MFDRLLPNEELVNMILDRLPKWVWESTKTKFLDPCMAGGQFVQEIERRLRTQGHNSSNIRSRVFGIAPSILALRVALDDPLNKLVGSYKVGPQLKDLDMKFNVIVGNPPFQDASPTGNRNRPLWTKFIQFALENCVPGGYITFITPQSWMSPNKTFALMTGKNLLYVNTDIKKYFPGVGSTFCAWLIENVTGDGKINIDGQVVDTTATGMIPKDMSPTGISISTKFFSEENKLNFHRVCNHHTQKTWLFGEKSKKYRYPILFKPSKTLWSQTASPVQTKKKVVIFLSSYPRPMYDSVSGTSEPAFFKTVNSKREGMNLVNILNSKLFVYAFEVSRRSRYNLKTTFDKLPYLDYRESWTDEEIYDYFGLTQKERKHVEAYLA